MKRHGNARYAKCVAETLENRTLMSAVWGQGVWQISSEMNVAGDTDTIEIRYAAGDASTLEAYVNGQLADTRSVSKLRVIRIIGSDRKDVIAADFTGGVAIRCVVFGKGGDDQITTGDGNDLVLGGKGDDIVSLGDGRDRAVGGSGNDTLNGEEGRDILNGNGDDDTLDGGGDGDILRGEGGDDSLSGGTGHDTMDGGRGQNYLRGSRSFDHIIRRRGDLVDNGNEANPLRAVTPEEIRQMLIDAAVARYASLYGTTYTRYPWIWCGSPIYTIQLGDRLAGGSGGMVFASTNAAASPAVLSENSYSGTNNQVAGVEEADLIRTDGNHVYILRQKDGGGAELTILRTVDPDNPTVVSRTDLEGWPRAMFVTDDRVTVIASEYGAVENLGSGMLRGPYGDQTRVTILDVSDDEAPTVVESTKVDGVYIDARETGGELYLVLSENSNLPGPRSTRVEGAPVETPKFPIQLADTVGISVGAMIRIPPVWGGDAGTYRYETEAEYRAYVESIIDAYLPDYAVTDGSGATVTESLLTEDIYVPERMTSGSLTTIVNMGLLDDAAGIEDSASAFGFAGEVYATSDALYMATTGWSMDDNQRSVPSTDVYKFDLGAGVVDFAAAGVVPGHVLNQFSMDEFGGYLRLATTTWGISSWTDTDNGVYVLGQEGASLQVVGSVDGLGKGERIQSARFIGDRGFVVTFRRTDPLFALDLSDPFNPVVRGELKIPGFSSYLQMIDDTHLLGIGTGEDANGSLSTLQLSVFDVSNLAHPKVVEQLSLGFGWSASSPARWDSHAVSWFGESGVLVIPASGWWDNSFHQGFWEFSIDPKRGFDELGFIEHHEWGGERSVRINDRVYTISDGLVKVTELGKPENVVAEVSLVRA